MGGVLYFVFILLSQVVLFLPHHGLGSGVIDKTMEIRFRFQEHVLSQVFLGDSDSLLLLRAFAPAPSVWHSHSISCFPPKDHAILLSLSLFQLCFHLFAGWLIASF